MKVYIVNVRSNEPRRNHMISQLSGYPCLSDYMFMHQGDIADIDSAIMEYYFAGELTTIGPATSCTYKHLLIYQALLQEEHHAHYLVLEDDIYLSPDFCARLSSIESEIKNRSLSNYLISLEDSNLRYVKRSLRRKGVVLYPQAKGRMAGAYLIDKEAARFMLEEVQKYKCHYPIDWFHNFCASKGIISIYWAHPSIATQGSLNGQWPSSIDAKAYGKIRAFKFYLRKLYRKLMYELK